MVKSTSLNLGIIPSPCLGQGMNLSPRTSISEKMTLPLYPIHLHQRKLTPMEVEAEVEVEAEAEAAVRPATCDAPFRATVLPPHRHRR